QFRDGRVRARNGGNDQCEHGRPHHLQMRDALHRRQREGSQAGRRFRPPPPAEAARPHGGVLFSPRQYGISKHGLQVGHAGRKGSTTPPAAGARPLKADENPWETLAPSAIPYGPDWHVPRAMTKDDMKSTLADYISMVKRAERIGYDLL